MLIPDKTPQCHPRTLVGQWMRAVALRHDDLSTALNEQMKSTDSWRQQDKRASIDAIISNAFTLIIQRRFPSDADVSDIGLWVFEVHRRVDRMPVLAAEALVREVLGQESWTGDISPEDATMSRWFLFLRAFMDLYYDPVRGRDAAELDAILCAAEKLAEAKGFNPLPASDL